MKIPDVFKPEKDLENKIFQLTEKSLDRKTSQSKEDKKQKIDAKHYYWKFVNIKRCRDEDKELTLDNIKNYLKDLTDEEALEVLDYGKMEKEKYLEYLAYR